MGHRSKSAAPMSAIRWRLTVWLSAIALALSGCGDPLSNACHAELSHRARCDSTYSGDQFSRDLRSCNAQPRNVRDDYYANVTRCYEQHGCPHSSSELSLCVGRASSTLVTSAAARSAATALCAACASRIAPNRPAAECEGIATTPTDSWGSPTGPIPVWILNDTTIDRLMTCVRAGAADCATVNACVRSTLR